MNPVKFTGGDGSVPTFTCAACPALACVTVKVELSSPPPATDADAGAGAVAPVTLSGTARLAGAPSRTVTFSVAGLAALSDPSVRSTPTVSANGAPVLPVRFSSVSAVSPPNTPAGKLLRLLPERFSPVSEVSPPNTPAGRLLRLLPERFSPVSEVSPAKSPDFSDEMDLLARFSEPVMPARSALVTAPHSVFPATAATMASRTAEVRKHTPNCPMASTASAGPVLLPSSVAASAATVTTTLAFPDGVTVSV